MRAQHYDAVFLGTRTPTLLTAAYLARNGLRVLVLGQGTPEPTYKIDGIEVPRASPLSLPLRSPAARHVLEAIAVMPSLKRRASPKPIALPIRIAGKSVDLARDESLRARTIEREFPEARRAMASFERRARLSTKAFDDFFDRGGTLSGRGFRASRALARLERDPIFGGDLSRFDPLGELRREPDLARAIQLCTRFRTNHAHGPEGFPLGLAFERGLDGPFDVEGGESWLRRVVVERIESYGGDVRPRVSADLLLSSGRSVSGLRLRTSLEEIGAAAVIAAVPAARLLPLLPDGAAAAACRALLEQPRPTLARHVLNLGFVAEGIPRGFDHELYHLPSDESLGIAGLHVQRANQAEGLVWLSVASLVPLPLPEGAVMRARVLEVVRGLFPFADRHLRHVDSPHEDIVLKGDGAAAAPEPGAPPLEPSAPETLDDVPRGGPLGLVGLPSELPIEGFHLVGPQCLPDLGVEGEILSGLEVARAILKKSGSARFSRLAPFRSRRW